MTKTQKLAQRSRGKLGQESGREDKDDAKNGHPEEQASMLSFELAHSHRQELLFRMTRDSSEMPLG